jgi:hypothetical protein
MAKHTNTYEAPIETLMWKFFGASNEDDTWLPLPSKVIMEATEDEWTDAGWV